MKNLIVSAVCCVALIAGPSFAVSKSRELEANRKIMFDYAKCVVKKRHDRAAEAIVSNLDNDTIQKQYSDLIIGDCLVKAVGGGAEMTFGGDLYRYALADALVNADYAAAGEADFSNRAPLTHLAMPSRSEFDTYLSGIRSKRRREAAQAEFDRRSGVVWLSHFGECVVRQDPVNARMWLLAPTDVAEETIQINALRPAFDSCLGQGTSTFNRITLRGTVALNYYRLASAAIQPAAGKPN